MEEITVQDDMYRLLNKFDSVFSPSLSENSIVLKQYAEKLINNAVTYVVKEDDEVTGFISFYVDDELEYSYITLLAVLPKYQGRKIAQALVDQCIEKSIKMNKKEIKLEVKNNNLPAIRFYKKNNFEVVEYMSGNYMYMKRKI